MSESRIPFDNHNDSASSATEDYNFANCRALFVDDNEVCRRIGLMALNRFGVDVDLAADGHEAVSAIEKKDYDVVFMDIEMPRLDGMEATEKIRSFGSRYHNLPIIAMTALEQSTERDKILSSGINEHISKPINSKNLFNVLLNFSKITPSKISKQEKTDHSVLRKHSPPTELLNYHTGLRQLDYNDLLYQKFLNRFLRNRSDSDQRIVELLQVENHREAYREAHTICGLASGIGAENLSQQSAILVRMIKMGGKVTHASDEMVGFSNSLRKTIGAIEKYLAESRSDASANDYEVMGIKDGRNRQMAEESIKKARELLQKLAVSVADALINDCITQIVLIKQQMLPVNLVGEIEIIEDKINNYEFIAAADLISFLLNRLDQGER